MATRFDRLLRAGGLVLLALGVSGCAAGGGWAASLVVLIAVGAMGVSGCAESHGRGGDGAIEADAGDVPPGPDAGGDWEPCCVDGRIESCFCEAGWECNYGWFETCSDGSCVDFGVCPSDDAGVDAGFDGSVDAGPEGTWEPCCVAGRVDACFCPGGAECNYGWYTDCGGGTCVDPGSMCPPPEDAGVDAGADAGGYWEPCCIDGVIESCFCPAGVPCNYGWYETCADGSCAEPGTGC